MNKIKLTQGQYAVVDDIDYDYLMQWKWFAKLDQDTQKFYAVRTGGKFPFRKQIRMHCVVLERVLGREIVSGEIGDHLLGDTLDNRRAELSIKNIVGNRVNASKQKNNTSGYKGVFHKKSKNVYIAQIKRNKHLSQFPYTQEGKIECAKMYDRAYLYFFGDMATERGMNFPELKEQYLNDLKINNYRWKK